MIPNTLRCFRKIAKSDCELRQFMPVCLSIYPSVYLCIYLFARKN